MQFGEYLYAQRLSHGINVLAMARSIQAAPDYYLECLLHNRNTESCRPEMEKVASPFWRKLQNPLEGNPRNGRRHIR